MKQLASFLLLFIFTLSVFAQGQNEDPNFKNSPDLKITDVSVVFDSRLSQLIFTIETEGLAGNSTPSAFGKMDGAPVLGYVFPTTLKPEDVGFSTTEGIVALALTSHPDFDDTPLWDENNDRNYANDGVIWHPHWVVLTEDTRVSGGLAVKQFNPDDKNVTLPPTNPGMPMYMDSPGYPVITKENEVRVVVPAYRMSHKTQFNFDAVTAYMQVNASNANYPMLGVYAVYSIASGDLSLPFTVSNNL
ncbi:hypothetical protein [Flammeovirga sp. SJP92]|uniref:hypothetical protein n=1 Tax=Flammeovirga sp. SJP92 TaxID=1775430 RepID=UPI000787FC52|nr:hypothetical protein [Flammeovirga sp. SJP92]KXX71127.1 hypothetical protein AVL50_09860 [Flammeovirga sp. SJP92]